MKFNEKSKSLKGMLNVVVSPFSNTNILEDKEAVTNNELVSVGVKGAYEADKAYDEDIADKALSAFIALTATCEY